MVIVVVDILQMMFLLLQLVISFLVVQASKPRGVIDFMMHTITIDSN